MIVVDTTVLVYAVGDSHPLRAPSRQLVELVRDAAVEATTTVEVIQEFVHVRARRRTRRDAAQAGADYAALFSPLLRPDAAALRQGLDLFEESNAIGAFDAVLAATAAAAGASAFVSADRAFATVADLPFVDLASDDLVRALRRV